MGAAGQKNRLKMKNPMKLLPFRTSCKAEGRGRNRPGLMVPYGREDASWHLRAEDLNKILVLAVTRIWLADSASDSGA